MSDCIFCKIIAGDIPSTKVYEDDKIFAFQDINPEAPVHFLVIPKEHIASLDTLDEGHKDLVGHINIQISKLAKDLGIAESGYRVVTNIGDQGGQTVHHLHYHVLGGRSMQWPPG